MKFLMLVRVDPSFPVVEDDINLWLTTAGSRRVEGDQLAPPADATTVRDSGRMITDGPFADTKEFIAGYDVLDCADMAEAVELAAAHPVAKFGAIELRPFRA
jgi:hypothetical protein